MISIVFFGTNKFAAIILEAIIHSGLFDIQTVITQPDRPVGRHQEIEKCAVKILAEKNGLVISQPETLKNFEPISDVDLNIVVEYGLIIPQIIIDAPKHGSINIHPSPLPKYRGPSPIQAVLFNGEKETAVSIMLMDKKMDHGPILAQESVEILPDDDFVSLSEKLSGLSVKMLIDIVPKYLEGKIKPTIQDDSAATFCKILNKEDGKVDFTRSAQEIYNQFRALVIWPGIFCFWDEKRLKLKSIKPCAKTIRTGEVLVENNEIFIGCQTGALQIFELQPEGKKTMNTGEFINGYKNFNHTILK